MDLIHPDVIYGILTEICELGVRNSGKYVTVSSRITTDREGGNHIITGTVICNNEIYEFECENGNWNGTVITNWEVGEKCPEWKFFDQLYEAGMIDDLYHN